MEHSELDLAYMAGIIDGEGHIGIQRTNRAADDGVQYGARIALRMTDEGTVRMFADLFGGTPRSEGIFGPLTRRPLYSMEFGGRSALPALTTLAPYLRLKREQAQICIDLEALKKRPGIRTRFTGASEYRKGGKVFVRNNFSIAQEIMDEMESMYRQIKNLNKPPLEP